MMSVQGLLGGFLLISSVAVTEVSQAQVVPVDFSIHQQFIAPRAIGMGDTFSGVNDFNMIFYNPAGLAVLEEPEMNFGIQGDVTPAMLDFKKDLDTASTQADSTGATIAAVNKQYGKGFGLRFPTIGALWARPGWGIAIIPADLSVNLAMNAALGPAVSVSAYQDATIAFAYAKAFMEKKLRIGANVKGIYRAYVGESIQILDLVGNSNFFRPENAKEGLTVDMDLSAQYEMTIPEDGALSFLKYAKPTFSAAVRNLFDYGFKQNLKLLNKADGDRRPPNLERRLDLGSRWDLPEFWVFKPRFLFDIRDIGHTYWTFRKGLHVGADLIWKVKTWLNGNYSLGLSQGYLTAGIGAELGWFRLDVVTYGEEMGTTDAKRENRYYMLRTSLDF
jgi:hypothetical protein